MYHIQVLPNFNRVMNLSIACSPSRNAVSGCHGKSRCAPFHLCITRSTCVLLTSLKDPFNRNLHFIRNVSNRARNPLGSAPREVISGTPLWTSRLDNKVIWIAQEERSRNRKETFHKETWRRFLIFKNCVIELFQNDCNFFNKHGFAI